MDARVREAEEEAKVEAEAIRKMFEAEATKIRQVPEGHIQQAVAFVLRETLKIE